MSKSKPQNWQLDTNWTLSSFCHNSPCATMNYRNWTLKRRERYTPVKTWQIMGGRAKSSVSVFLNWQLDTNWTLSSLISFAPQRITRTGH